MNPQTSDYSEIPEQQWTPRWNEEQLSNIISQYKSNPSLYPPEVIQQIKHHASHYNKPFYEGDFSIKEALGQFGLGLIAGFTTYDAGKHPDNEYEAIIRNIGHLIGFVPGITAPLFKAAGLSAKLTSQIAGIKSVPMLIADKVMKGAKGLARPAVAAARAGRVDATKTAANFITRGPAKHIAEGAFHLGVASGVSSWQSGIDGMMDSFFGGAVAGAGFRAIGNFVKVKGHPKGQKYVRALAGSLFMGLPATMQGATTPELVYQYLLGAFFGGQERTWQAHGSMKFQKKMVKESEAGNNKLAVTRSPKDAEGFKELDPEIQDRVVKDAEKRWGNAEENLAAGHYLIENLGLGEIVDGEASKESWDGLKKVIAGQEIATKKEKGKGPVQMAISGAASGADVHWSRVLKSMGVETVQYVPEGKGVSIEKQGIPGIIRELSEKELSEAGPRVMRAAKALNKSAPSDPKSREFVYRNWFQAKFADAIFGIGAINTSRRTVRGGSGWTVEYAKQLKKPVYFFEQPTNKWFKFDYRLNQFKALDYTPTLTKKPAVIGSRQLWKQGVKAIEDVVSKTFGKKLKEKATKGGVSEEDIVSPGPEMRAKILKAENTLAKYQSEVATYNEAIEEMTKKKKKTAKEKAELLQLKKEYKISAKAQLATEQILEKMYEVPAGHTLDKKGEIVPEDKNDTDVGMKYDLEVGKRAEQYVNKFISKLTDKPDNISKKIHTLELSNKLETILEKHVSRGDAPKMDALIAEIEKEFDGIVLSPEASGELKQWLNIKNNAIENRYINITIDKGIHIKPMTVKRRMTPAGNRKYQREPEKLIERMFVNAGGKPHKDLGALVIADNVTVRNKNGSLQDKTFAELRRGNKKQYNDVIAKLNRQMYRDGFYLFGGRGDADRFYYVKFHPASGKTDMAINAKFLSTIKKGTKNNNEYIKARDEFADRNSPRMKKPKSKKIFDRAFESNILYDLALNGFPVKMVGKNVEIGEGYMTKKMTPFQKKKQLDSYIQTMFGPGFINGVVGFNKRLQIIMTPSWPGNAELAKTRIKDLNDEGRLNYVIVNDLTEKPEFWRHFGNDEAGIRAVKNSLFVESVDGAIITRDDIVDYMNEDAGMPKSGQNKSFIISTQNDPKTGKPMGALYGKYMSHKAGKKLSAEMKEKGLHYIVYESSAKQHGTRTIGDYKINDKGKLEIDKESMYSLDPSEIKYNYSVKQNAHMWRGEHVIAKQALAHLTQSAYASVPLDMINDIYEGTIMERFRGKTEANELLAKAMEEGSEINVTKKLIEDVGINELLRAVHSEHGTKFADAAYQRLFKLNAEAIEQSRIEGEITEEQSEGMMNELTEFNQATDRMITQSLIVSRGSKKGALPVMLHKWIRPYRAVMMRNFLVHAISRPKIGNSGNARMRPYDKALRMDFDDVNPRLKELENRDDIFFLDEEYRKMPIETHIRGMSKTTLEELWNKYDAEGTSKGTKDQIAEVLRAVVLRVPMDSISGAHALKFRGFTGRDGHGILLHSRAMRQLGGADLDGDEAFMYFGGRNKAGEGKGFKKEWKDVYEANKDESLKYRHINTGEIITPEQYKKKSKLQKSKGKWLKYIPDPKSGIVNRPDSKFGKKMSYRDLLTESGKDKTKTKALKNSKIYQYAPSMRQYISEKAVDGRNTLGPAVSMPQVFKTAHSMMMASENKSDFFEVWKKEKGKWIRYGVKVEPRTEEEWFRYQRELGQAMVAFASDPMDEVGLKGHAEWYKQLWDSYFKITNVKNLSKRGKRTPIKELFDIDNFVEKFKFYGLKGSTKWPSLLSKVDEMNSALFGKDWTNNKMWEESEIRNKIKFLHDLTPDEMPVLLAKMGDTIGMTEQFGDSIAKRVDRKKLIKWYEEMEVLAEKERWLAPIIGKSGFRVPYNEIIDNVLKLKIYETQNITNFAATKDEFLRAIKGTSYSKDKTFMDRLLRSEPELKKLGLKEVELPERTEIIKEMVRRTDEFITNDLHDMISLRKIVPLVKSRRDNLTGRALKEFDKMIRQVFNKSDFFKENSAMKRKQRKEVDDYYEKINVMPQDIQDLYESIVKIVPGVKGFKIPTGEEGSSTMDQVVLDIEMGKYKKTLTPYGRKLFDYFMLGTWDRAHVRRANKVENILRGTKINHPLFHDLIHMVKMAGAHTSLNKVAYGSEAISDANIRTFMKDFLDISGEIYHESPKEIETVQKNIEKLKEKKKITLGDGTEVDATIFDGNIDPKVEGTYTADLSGFEGLVKGKLNPKDAKVIEELAFNIKYHYPEIGARLGEVVRGIMEKELNAMNREDFIIFNAILKEQREGTFNQKLDVLMGKDFEGRAPELKKRYYMQFPEAVNKEVMKYDITWLRNKGAFLTRDGEWKEGPVQKPSWFLQRTTDIIGIMNQQGMQLTEELTGELNQDLLFMEGIKENEVLRKIAVDKMEYDFERGSIMRNEKMLPEAKAAAVGEIARAYKESVKNASDLLEANHRIVDSKTGERVPVTGWEVVEKIMDVYEKSNEKAFNVLSGDPKALDKYTIGYWNDARTEPMIDYMKFMKDMFKLYNEGKPMPREFGVDGLRQVARSMSIDLLSKDKKGKELREKLMNSKLRMTKSKHFRGFWPHIFFSGKEVVTALNKRVIEIMKSSMKPAEKDAEIKKLVVKHKMLTGDWIDPSDGLWDQVNRGELSEAVSQVKGRKKKDRMDWWKKDLTIKSMGQRVSYIPGYSKERSTYESYLRNVGDVYYKQLNYLFTRAIIESYKKRAFKKGWYKKNDYPEHRWTDPATGEVKKGMSIGQAWENYLKLYAQGAMGNPDIIPDRIYEDPSMKIKGTPYGWWADNKVRDRMNKIKNSLFKGQKLHPKLEKIIDTDMDHSTIMKISNLEAKFELAALLAHPKSMVANIFGGSMHTIQSAGWEYFKRAQKISELSKINPEWTSKEAVQKFVVKHGVIPEFIMYEWGLSPELRSANTTKFMQEAVTKYVGSGKEVDNQGLRELAKKYQISKPMMDKAALFMSIPETKLRRDAFMAHYLRAYDKFGGAFKSFDHPFLIEYAKKGVKATQFLYSAPYRPAFARTALGKVMTRFQLWSWNAVRFRNDVIKQARLRGMGPGSEHFERFKRTAQIDLFVFAMGNLFAYSLFETAMPAPWNWLQDTSDWLFGDEKERDRAFFGTWPTSVAPLQMITPPILRFPAAGLTGFIKDDYSKLTDYHLYTALPFGRLGRDFSPWAPGNLVENPMRLIDKWTGFPLTGLQKEAKRNRKEEPYYPWSPNLSSESD